ncbi:hypothetical protein [Methylobacterium fujisawaense]|uniref:hypothetical protein n=1 Tax=Methylobacterium fujisawaense TaxID=107400 RepID=UPI00244C769B|nr:hypothetical protein [Methylobacterium fujisawaense]MDH3031066.1 hypothetical protein [Methylobacterium fujisawaense]
MIAAEATAAREALALREAEFRRAGEAYEASLDQGREAALAADRGLDGARVDRDIARRAVERLEAEHEAARDAEEHAAVAGFVAEADEALAVYQQACEQLLPEMSRMGRQLVRAWAVAQLANENAEKALKAQQAAQGITSDMPCRPGVEAFRTWPGRPRELVTPALDRTLWTNAAGEAVGEPWQSQIREQVDGTGVLSDSGGRTVFEHRRTFREETFLRQEDGRTCDLLVRSLRIPGVTAADRDGWKPLDYADPRKALAQLDEMEQPAANFEDRRRPETETVPVGAPVKVGRASLMTRALLARTS